MGMSVGCGKTEAKQVKNSCYLITYIRIKSVIKPPTTLYKIVVLNTKSGYEHAKLTYMAFIESYCG